jgi:CRISPR system Cascade subunit CasC
MFVQIHMLQSMPPGNLNRDENGQPKKCLFGGVTRGRISSQCLKRNIRRSPQFMEAFGDDLAVRTMKLPQMVADNLRDGKLGVPDDELDEFMAAIAKKFKSEKDESDSEVADDAGVEQGPSENKVSDGGEKGKTGQLVFFQQPFARRIAELVAEFRRDRPAAYRYFLRGEMTPETEEDKAKFKMRKDELKKRKADIKKEEKAASTDEHKAAIEERCAALEKDEEAFKKVSENKKDALKAEVGRFIESIATASKTLTVDIGLFGRMTTSALVVNVDAACQVAHAIGTHETVIERDWFTAMDDKPDKAGAGYIGSGENVTFYNADVYYKYLNLDLDAMRKHLPSLTGKDAAQVAGVLISAAALANPTGKQNSFGNHSFPEAILVEVSQAKRPLSYANAFLQPVEGGVGRNLMTESAKAFKSYVESIAPAFAPANMNRVLMAVGAASILTQGESKLNIAHTPASTLDELVNSVVALIIKSSSSGAIA